MSNSFWRSKKVLVAGGAGSVGSYLVELLLEAGAVVSVADNLSRGRLDNLSRVLDRITFTNADLRYLDACERVCEGQDVVMNLAAPVFGVEYSMCHNAEMLTDVVLIGFNMLEAARRKNPLPPLFVDQAGTLFETGARKLGYHPFSTPHAILSQPYQGRPACTYCGFCQAFGCHVGAKSSILVTKLPEADATGNFKLLTGAMCYRVNSDNSGSVTGVAYYGPDGSDNTIEAELVILTPFIYDNVRLLLLSKTAKFPNGLANSSGEVGKHLMGHISAKVFAAFDDRYVNIYMGPNAQRYSLDDFNADNFDHSGLPFIRGAQISVSPADLEAGPIGTAMSMNPPPGIPRWGAAYRDFLAKRFARHAGIIAQAENLPYADQTIDLDPNVRDQWGLPAPRMTYDWRRPNELARMEFLLPKLEELGRAMGAAQVWRSPLGQGSPGPHHEGGTRMGSDPKTSVVNRYGQSWDIPNLFIVGSSTHPTMSGFNPTLTIQALAYMSADAIVNRYKNHPGPLL